MQFFPRIHHLKRCVYERYCMFTLTAIFVAVLLSNKKKNTFNSTVNFEIVSKMFEMFENIIKSNLIAK